MSFSELNQVMGTLVKRYPELHQRMAEAKTLSGWTSVVGPTISRHARPLRIRQGTLFVEVEHPIWRAELKHRKRQILDKLAENTDFKLRDLVFVGPNGHIQR